LLKKRRRFAMTSTASNQPSDQPAQSMPSTAPMSPGDEAPAGTPGTGPDVCRACGGTGKRDGGAVCPECQGTGQVTVGIGGA
jgi:hypothetical protein